MYPPPLRHAIKKLLLFAFSALGLASPYVDVIVAVIEYTLDIKSIGNLIILLFSEVYPHWNS